MLDISIIGGGPAGLTAGLYAVRGGADTMLFEALFTGGQAVKAHHIDNIPGFPEGISGADFSVLLEQQIENTGLSVNYSAVSALDLTGDIKKVILTDGTCLESRTVILAMGAVPRPLGLPNESALTGKGVSYCATCDGAFYKGKRVAVVGGGDTAVSDALYLAGLCEKVFLIHRRDTLRASDALCQVAFRTENIEFVWNTVPTALLGDERLSGLSLRNVQTNETSELSVSGLFVAVGILPASALVRKQLPLDAGGFIPVNASLETAEPGVFAAGDVRVTPLRQVVTACADGAVAAASALEYVRTRTVTVL